MTTQFLTTSRLSNIINMIGLGRQSGILRVIRGQGQTRELGQIKFVDGEPVTALLGQLTGLNALTVLSNWGECIYSFDEQVVPDPPESESPMDLLNRLAQDPGRYSPISSTSDASSGSWPTYSWPSTAPSTSQNLGSLPSGTYGPPQGMPGAPGGPGYGGNPYGGGSNPYGGDPYSGGYGGYGGAPPSSTNLPGVDPYGRSRPNAPAVQVTEPLSSAVLASCPRRTVLSEQVDRLPLDRRERMVLLLVDGRRTVSDLARLTRRNEREVLAVLDHMARLGLIAFDS
jgi:hypothetical protein